MDVKPNRKKVRVKARVRAQLCEKGGGPGLPVPNSPYGLCERKATLKKKKKKKKKPMYSQPRSLWTQSNSEEEEEEADVLPATVSVDAK